MGIDCDGWLLPVVRKLDVTQSWWQPELVGPLLQDLWQGEIDWVCLDDGDAGGAVAEAARRRLGRPGRGRRSRRCWGGWGRRGRGRGEGKVMRVARRGGMLRADAAP
jgi:hypothetical protein